MATLVVAVDQLSVQFFIKRKHNILEVIAEDVILGNQLHASVRFSVVEQQTVAVHTVAALPPDQAADLPKLSCFDFNEHSLISPYPDVISDDEAFWYTPQIKWYVSDKYFCFYTIIFNAEQLSDS